jgi:uncharacterized protein
MIQPNELKTAFQMDIGGSKTATTTAVWAILVASYNGDLESVKQLVAGEPNLAYSQYNYMPPIHLAVREGHQDLVAFLLGVGACDPGYKSYPFLDNLVTIASDREYVDIAEQLRRYAEDPSRQKFKGDNGRIHFTRSALQQKFEDAVDRNDFSTVEEILHGNPEYASDETYFWGEGILMMPAKTPEIPMLDLLLSYGAKVPPVLKWTQAYYFKHYAGAAHMLRNGMDPNTMSCHHVTILHDMAQKGYLDKAELLISHGANINLIDDEYLSTPLGMAARWGQKDMVNFLLEYGADPNKSGVPWSRPLAWAAKKGHDEIATLLKNAGASVR